MTRKRSTFRCTVHGNVALTNDGARANLVFTDNHGRANMVYITQKIMAKHGPVYVHR